MNFKKYYITSAFALAVALTFSGCAKYDISPNKVELKAQFGDKKWDGKKVPSDEVCSDYNKHGGNSPKIIITNLPKDTNKIILSYNDESNTKMNNGGHGVVSYEVDQYSSILTIPSFKGETFDLPTNLKSIKAHRGTQFGKTPGAYLPPCSGGKGNIYSVSIEAVHDFNSEEKKPTLLGDTKVRLGTY